MRHCEIRDLVLSGKNMEDLLECVGWKEFENFIKEIFEENRFKVRGNFRFKNERRYEIDLIAIDSKYVFCVDCKQWGSGRYKKSGLKTAVKEQENRMRELMKFLKNNEIAKGMLKVDLKKQRFHSLIVTLMQEDLLKEGNTLLVPVWMLNSFLLDREKYII